MTTKNRMTLASLNTFETPKASDNIEENPLIDINVNVNNDVKKNVNDYVKKDSELSHQINELDKTYKEIKGKRGIEETHTRHTILVRNDLSKRLDRIAKQRGKGWKTKIMNLIIEDMLNQFEKGD